MIRSSRFRTFLLVSSALACATLSSLASAQDPCKGGDCQTTGGGTDDPVFPATSGGLGDPNPPNPPGATPEPFTLALGAGAVGLYARRRYVRSRQTTSV